MSLGIQWLISSVLCSISHRASPIILQYFPSVSPVLHFPTMSRRLPNKHPNVIWRLPKILKYILVISPIYILYILAIYNWVTIGFYSSTFDHFGLPSALKRWYLILSNVPTQGNFFRYQSVLKLPNISKFDLKVPFIPIRGYKLVNMQVQLFPTLSQRLIFYKSNFPYALPPITVRGPRWYHPADRPWTSRLAKFTHKKPGPLCGPNGDTMVV